MSNLNQVYIHKKTGNTYRRVANVKIKMPDQNWVVGVIYTPIGSHAEETMKSAGTEFFVRLLGDFVEKFESD